MNPSSKTLRMRNRQQAAIAVLSQIALDEADIELLLERAVLLLADTLSVEYAKILEWCAQTGDLRLVAGVGWQEGLVGYTRIDAGEKSQAGYTLLAGAPVIVDNLPTETRFYGPQLLIDHRVISGMSVAIPGKQRPYGVLGAHSSSYRRFTSHDIHFLEATAGILASAIRRKQTEQELQQYAKRLEIQHEIDRAILTSQNLHATASTVVHHVCDLVSCTRASVAVFNFREASFSVLASVSDHVCQFQIREAPIDEFPAEPDRLASGQVVVYEDLSEEVQQNQTVRRLRAEGVRSFACIPLLADGELVGSLNLGFDQRGPIQIEKLNIAQEVADVLAIAFQQTRLAESEHRRLNYLDELHAIDLAIISGKSVSNSLSVIVEKVVSSLKVDAATILLYERDEKILKYGAGSGFRTSGIRGSRLRLGEGIAGRAAAERKIIFAHNLEEAGENFVRHPLLEGENFSAYYAVPLIAKNQLKGVLDVFHRAPLIPDQEWFDFLQALATQAAIAIDNAQLFIGMQKANHELALAYDETIEGWSRALDLRDKETEGHSRRVTALTIQLARRLGIEEGKLVHIRRGALLHDIGKVGIPDSILLKPGPLTTEELEIMHKHPFYAYELLTPISYLHPALEIPYCHHELWNGSGYPRGLRGEAIPLAARIFCVADVWDALRSDRPYRDAWSREAAIEYINGQAGKMFDPQIATAFLEMIQLEGEAERGLANIENLEFDPKTLENF